MTGTGTSALDLLAACLPALGATELGRGPGQELIVSLPVALSDGRLPVYQITVSVKGMSASAKEASPTLLPAFCPERHINADGSFCLYWSAIDDIIIDGLETALVWWETLARFLQLQTRAARRRRWPQGQGRAHGSAALHQHRAEKAAAKLGDPLATDMQEGKLSVVVRGNGAEGPGVRVMRNGYRVYTVWLRSKRVVNLRRPCLCGEGSQPNPRTLRSCSDHADAAATLALELSSMAKQERRFWDVFAGYTCCGTMDDCPLAQPTTAPAAHMVAA